MVGLSFITPFLMFFDILIPTFVLVLFTIAVLSIWIPIKIISVIIKN